MVNAASNFEISIGETAALIADVMNVQVEIKNNKVLIKDDPIILDMILKLNGNVKEVLEKFNPEGGAYGLGRTHSHKH